MSVPEQTTRDAIDYTAAGVGGLTLLQILPAIAAVFSIIWLGIRIYEQVSGRDFSSSRIAKFLTRLVHRDG